MAATSDTTEILERLRRVIPDTVGIDPARLTPEAELSDIGIDSYSLIELVFVAEEEFQIRIPFEGLAVKSVGDVVALIQRNLALSSPRNESDISGNGSLITEYRLKKVVD